jgi:hypothetical protein
MHEKSILGLREAVKLGKGLEIPHFFDLLAANSGSQEERV